MLKKILLTLTSLCLIVTIANAAGAKRHDPKTQSVNTRATGCPANLQDVNSWSKSWINNADVDPKKAGGFMGAAWTGYSAGGGPVICFYSGSVTLVSKQSYNINSFEGGSVSEQTPAPMIQWVKANTGANNNAIGIQTYVCNTSAVMRCQF